MTNVVLQRLDNPRWATLTAQLLLDRYRNGERPGDKPPGLEAPLTTELLEKAANVWLEQPAPNGTSRKARMARHDIEEREPTAKEILDGQED